MKCPKCGYRRQIRDNAFVPATECPTCGVVYSKHEKDYPAGPGRGTTLTASNLRPSPVDAASLKKARDRVEKRLRDRLQIKVKDERHAQTLKLARQITAEEVRKRQLQWKTKHRGEVSAPASGQWADATQAAAVPSAAEQPPKTSAAMPANDQTERPDVAPAPLATQAPSNDPAPPAGQETVAPIAPETRAPTQPPASRPGAGGQTAVQAPPRPAPAGGKPAPVSDAALDVTSPQGGGSQKNAHAAAEEVPAAPQAIEASSQSAFRGLNPHGKGPIRTLSTIAWLILSAGVVGAVLSWTTIGNVEAGTHIPVPASISILPFGLLLGLAYLATGVLGFAFFWVSSITNRQLKDIRRLLMLQSDIRAAAGLADDFSNGIEDGNPPASPSDDATWKLCKSAPQGKELIGNPGS